MQILIGGESFDPIDAGSYTLAYDIYMQQLLADVGITSFLASRPLGEDVAEAERRVWADELLRLIADSGRATDFIAGFVKPVGVAWTPAWARSTSTRLAALKSPHDRSLLLGMLLSGIAEFFNVGLRSLPTSLTSSAARDVARQVQH